MKIRTLILIVAISALANSIARADAAATPTPLAVADIDGIWAIQNASAVQQQVASYFSIRASATGLLVIIRLGTSDWQAFVTALAGNSATVTTVTTQAINSWRIDFASAQQATITGLLCIANGSGIQPLTPSPTVGAAPATDVIGIPISINRCFIPQGTVLTLAKVL